jgi:hypothetical protein
VPIIRADGGSAADFGAGDQARHLSAILTWWDSAAFWTARARIFFWLDCLGLLLLLADGGADVRAHLAGIALAGRVELHEMDEAAIGNGAL